jgi:hypothetical protein
MVALNIYLYYTSMMNSTTIIALVTVIAVASMPLISMATSAHAANSKPWPRGNSNGFLNNPNHSYDTEPNEADNHHCVNTPSGNQNCQ